MGCGSSQNTGVVEPSTHVVPANGKADINTHVVPANGKAAINTHVVPANGKADINTHVVPANGKAAINTHDKTHAEEITNNTKEQSFQDDDTNISLEGHNHGERESSQVVTLRNESEAPNNTEVKDQSEASTTLTVEEEDNQEDLSDKVTGQDESESADKNKVEDQIEASERVSLSAPEPNQSCDKEAVQDENIPLEQENAVLQKDDADDGIQGHNDDSIHSGNIADTDKSTTQNEIAGTNEPEIQQEENHTDGVKVQNEIDPSNDTKDLKESEVLNENDLSNEIRFKDESNPSVDALDVGSQDDPNKLTANEDRGAAQEMIFPVANEHSNTANELDTTDPSEEMSSRDEGESPVEGQGQDEGEGNPNELTAKEDRGAAQEMLFPVANEPSNKASEPDTTDPSEEVQSLDEGEGQDEGESRDEVEGQDEGPGKDEGQDEFQGQVKGEGQLPPLSPPTKTQEELIPDPADFAELDNFVGNTPKSAASSVESLADYLTPLCSTDLEIVRAFFCWLAFNVEYDTGSYISGSDSKPQDADAVLQSGMAVCQGYSQLFMELCKKANIPCLLIQGLAKGYRHDPEDVYTVDTKTNHSWNLVHVQGEWRPLDVTWGAGHIDKEGNFHCKFKENWFLTDPDVFVSRHFPLIDGNLEESEKYQLLKEPLTLERFSASLRQESLAHQIGLTFLTHDVTVIDVTHDVIIEVRATRQLLQSVSVSLTERGPTGGTKDRSNTLTSLAADGTCTIYVRPPRAATYLLDVMGQLAGQDLSKLHQLVTYVIKCKEPHPDPEPFPDKYGVWDLQNPTATQCGLTRGSQGTPSYTDTTQPGQNHGVPDICYKAVNGEASISVYFNGFVHLRTQLRHARSMEDDLGHFTLLEYTEDGATVKARLPKRGYYMLRVFASHPEQSGFHHVADYLLFADQDLPCKPFPRAHKLAYQAKAKLLQPLQRRVLAGEATLFRVQAATLRKVSVGVTRMELKNDGVWEAEVTPEEGKDDISIFATAEDESKTMSGMYTFSVATSDK